MIQLTKENLQQLEQMINEIPTKFGLPLLQFFGKLVEEQTPSAKPVTEVEAEAV